MSDDDKEKADSQAEGFVDQLRQIQGEFLQLTDLYERERDYSQKLAELMRALQYEVDVTIPLTVDSIGSTFINASEGYLVSDSVVVAIDPSGATMSKPLSLLPPEIIISIVEDCTPQLKKLISEKRKRTARRVNSLEKVVKELKKAQATFKQSRTGAPQPEEGEEEMEPGEETNEATQPVQPASRDAKVVPAVKRHIQPDDDDLGGFNFSGNFEERRQPPAERISASQ